MAFQGEMVARRAAAPKVNFHSSESGHIKEMEYKPPQADPANAILPGLWLGNRTAALDPEFHRKHKIRAVFNCTKDIPFEASVMRRYRIPVDDNLQDEEIRNLELWAYEAVYKLAVEYRQAQKEGGGVLVHCAAGMQRSAAVTAMYLIAAYNLKTEDAIPFIQKRRPIAFRPSANFERAIRGFERAYATEVRPQLGGGAPAARLP